jgi:ribosome-associated heat shock protein Hsp15
MEDKESYIRIDKWLWAVRIYKTRSIAADACKAGKVKWNGVVVKPSKEAKVGEIYKISIGPLLKTIKIKALLSNRVAAKIAGLYMEDLTPIEEYDKLKLIKEMKQGIRPRGYGRPTKKERRDMEKFGDS